MWQDGLKFPTLHWWTPLFYTIPYVWTSALSQCISGCHKSLNKHTAMHMCHFLLPTENFLHLNPTKLHKAELSKHVFNKIITTIGCSSWDWKVSWFNKICPKTIQTSLWSLLLEQCTSHLAMALSHQGGIGHICCWTVTKPFFALCYPWLKLYGEGETLKDTWSNSNSPWAHSIHFLFKRAIPNPPNHYKDDICIRHHHMVTD